MESKGRCPESVSPCCVTFAVRGSAGRQEDLPDGLRNEHHRHQRVMSGAHRRAESGGVCEKTAHKLSQDVFGRAAFPHSEVQSTPRCRGWRKVFLDECLVSALSTGGQRQSKQDFKLSRQFWDFPRQGSHSEWRLHMAR